MPLPRPQAATPEAIRQAVSLAFDRIEHYEPWHFVGAAGEPAFQNSWVNSDADGSRPVRFRKDAVGGVHIVGLCKNGTLDTAIFTLPVGYRPKTYAADTNTLIRPIISNGVLGILVVMSTGVVKVTGSNVYADLGCYFFAEDSA